MEGSRQSHERPESWWRRPVPLAAMALLLVVIVLAGAWWVDRGTGAPTGADPAAPSPTPSDSGGSPHSEPSPTEQTAPGPVPPLGAPRDIATGLQVPWGVAFLPDGSALVSERTTASIVRVREGSPARVVGTVPGVTSDGEGGLLGIAVSPDFAADGLVYAYFTTDSDNRIVSMPLTDDGLGKPTVLLDGSPRASYHAGGRLLFGPDGMLYATTGDHGEPALAQDRRSLAGKILRITPAGAVPKDNPFASSPVWSYGHRNVQGLAFDDAGRLWATEFGESTYDELNLIEAGANYGWPDFEGDGGRTAVKRGMTNPKLTWPVAQASPSGLAYLGGVLYMGALRGERLWQIPLADTDAGMPRASLVGALGRIRTVAVAPSGDLWITTSNTDGRASEVAPDDDRVVSMSVG
jgi:glucose/arabinose dehydrogenase